MSLKELMNTELNKLSFIDIDGVTGGDSEYVSNKMHCIAVYLMQKKWLYMQKKGQGWGWLTFNKDHYVPSMCGPGMRESKRAPWDEMDKLTGSKHNYTVTILKAKKHTKELSLMMF